MILLAVPVFLIAQDWIHEIKGNSKGISFQVGIKAANKKYQLYRRESSDWIKIRDLKLTEQGTFNVAIDHQFGLNIYQIRFEEEVLKEFRYHNQYFNHLSPTGFVKNEWIVFQSDTRYKIFNYADSVVMKGRSDSIDISILERGEYTIQVGNISEKFFKNKP